jgi:deazaflavin-dependent oxidoreductase (nitroreductase family)
MKLRLVRAIQRYLVNPPVKALFWLGIVPPGYALLETVGRRSGRRRRTPVGDGLVDATFWIVAEHGRRAAYVRNLTSNPRVRVAIRRGRKLTWRAGTATVVTDDDAYERLRRLSATSLSRRINATAVRIVGTDLMTVRIDLD